MAAPRGGNAHLHRFCGLNRRSSRYPSPSRRIRIKSQPKFRVTGPEGKEVKLADAKVEIEIRARRGDQQGVANIGTVGSFCIRSPTERYRDENRNQQEHRTPLLAAS